MGNRTIIIYIIITPIHNLKAIIFVSYLDTKAFRSLSTEKIKHLLISVSFIRKLIVTSQISAFNKGTHLLPTEMAKNT